MINPPFKFEHWHLGSDMYTGDDISRYPILDWSHHYNSKVFEYRHIGACKNGFTGKYHSVFTFRFVVARHEFGFMLEWAFGTTTPELAYQEYHARIKANRGKQEQK